jgi:hemolysin III
VTEALLDSRTLAAPLRSEALAEIVDLRAPVPRLRGVSHEKAFAFAPALGLLLVAAAENARDAEAASVFALTMMLMLGVSAVNHRAAVPPHWRPWLRRLDHMTINLFVGGTWTSFALLVQSGPAQLTLTAAVWGGAAAASLVTVLWVQVGGWIPATIALVVGWAGAVVVIPDLGAASGLAGLGLFLLGGLFYTAGAVVYALRRPNPLPATVGYHEIFHTLVLAGAACHYLALAFFVLPLAS